MNATVDDERRAERIRAACEELASCFPVHVMTVEPGAAGVYSLSVPVNTRPELFGRFQEAWQGLWDRAGKKAPGLLVITDDMILKPVSDAELRCVGLMRIPEAT